MHYPLRRNYKMDKWKTFEIKCTDYLNTKFGAYAHFTHQGGTDSTVPDISVNTNTGNSFYIEVKYSPAQCGQFVLLSDNETGTFRYSPKNINRLNRYAQMIMKYMNENFDEFNNAGTTGKNIDMPNGSDIFADWIIQIYRAKGVEFFITNNYTILPIDRFHDYFDVTAKYRVKRSGSGHVGKSRLKSVMDYIESHDYIISDFRIDGNKLFVISPKQLHDQRFFLRGIEYMFSLNGNEYELRKLSNTYNSNVIFSIRYKAQTPGISENDFIDYLK
jgi:hypothetical protein